MEIKELVSYYINDTTKTIEVSFKLITDGEDEVRTDQINLSEIESFGYDFDSIVENLIFNTYDDDDDSDDIFGNFFNDAMDDEVYDEDIKSFLTEYYLVYPNLLPKPDFF
jgi:hypothetical protein